MMRAMCFVQHKDVKRAKNLMLNFCLNKTIDHQLAMANSMSWYGHVLKREDGQVESQMKKWKLKRTWKKQVDEESIKVGLHRKGAIC